MTFEGWPDMLLYNINLYLITDKVGCSVTVCCVLFFIKYRFGDLVDVIDNGLRLSDRISYVPRRL